MEITLKKIELETYGNKNFEKFIDNSYNEWSTNWNNVSKKVEKNSWSARFEIVHDNKVGEFFIDTHEDYLTFMDLEGYLGGEEFQVEDGLSLKVASHSSNILVAVVFSEAIRLGLIDEDEISYLSMMIFPEWSRGLVPNDVLAEEDVKEFFVETLKYLENKNYLRIYPIKIGEVEVFAEEKEDEFLSYAKTYIEKEIFFYTLKV